MALQLGDYAVIGGMFTTFAGVLCVVMLANLKAMARRVAAVEGRVADVERHKTEKHDWVREAGLTREKLETITVSIGKLDTKMEQNYGVAASINRLTDALAKTVEAP